MSNTMQKRTISKSTARKVPRLARYPSDLVVTVGSQNDRHPLSNSDLWTADRRKSPVSGGGGREC